jgi:hypothetical protein
MTGQLWAVLELIAHATAKGERVEPQTHGEFELMDRLFALGFLNIAPPGWCFKLNAAGKAALFARMKQDVAA